VPVLLWLLVHRRRSFGGALAAGLAVTLPALLTGLYPAFAAALVHGIEPAFEGNLGISVWVPWAGVPVSVLAVLVALLAVRREPGGLMVAGIAGTLIGTYVGLYAPVLPASLLARYERSNRRRGVVLGAIGSVAWLALPLAAAIAVVLVLLPPRLRWRAASHA
jgi:hypothetical protein